MHFMFLSQKNIQLIYKLSLPLICNFSNQIYLLILIWEPHTIINGPWEYHTTKQMHNYAAHNNQVVVTVSFFQLKVYVQYDCSHSIKYFQIFLLLYNHLVSS